jgi:hypothetical protein
VPRLAPDVFGAAVLLIAMTGTAAMALRGVRYKVRAASGQTGRPEGAAIDLDCCACCFRQAQNHPPDFRPAC